jgi:methylated-DNA-protein-cysteine methyltransferase-like protein
MDPRAAQDRDAVRQRILATVDAIPAGQVATYGQVAAEAGLPGRARLVGRLLRDLPAGTPLPWHRVVAAGGRPGPPPESPGGREARRRLRSEGSLAPRAERVDLARFGWRPTERGK